MDCAVCSGRRRILVSSDPDENETMACPNCGPTAEFAAAIKTEIAEARKKYPKPLNSPHEGYAVILEELEELKREVFKRPGFRNKANMREECAQIAAMAILFAEDLT